MSNTNAPVAKLENASRSGRDASEDAWGFESPSGHKTRESKYTKEMLAPLVESSTTIAEVVRGLGLPNWGGNRDAVVKLISKYELNIEHFNRMTTRTRYTDDALVKAVSESTSVFGVMRYFDLKLSGGNHSAMKKRLRDRAIDTSHFTGQGHMRGKASPKRRTHEEILVLKDPAERKTLSSILRRGMIESGIEYICASCGIDPMWNGKPLRLEIDHINGCANDNRKKNLRFLCPNCHSQEETSTHQA